MEPQPETATATVRVCGQDIQTTAEELKLAGLQVKDPADFTALSHRVANPADRCDTRDGRASSGLRALEPNWY